MPQVGTLWICRRYGDTYQVYHVHSNTVYLANTERRGSTVSTPVKTFGALYAPAQ